MFKLNSYLIYVIFQVCDEPVAYMYDTPGKKFLVYNHVTIKGGHVGGQYNKGLLQNLHDNEVQFPEERNAFVWPP